jgi:hypothetical protein
MQLTNEESQLKKPFAVAVSARARLDDARITAQSQVKLRRWSSSVSLPWLAG